MPAAGAALDDDAALGALLDACVPDAAARFHDPDLVVRAPDPGPRAALVSLAGTIAESLLDAFVAGDTWVDEVRLAAPASPTRIVGPIAGTPPNIRAANVRYQAEHPALLAGSLAHDLLWHSTGAGQTEEATLHAVCALVHVQRIAAYPALADLRTELARRQHSLAITLLNSRRPGSADVTLRAPDGFGTIPGGDSTMQTPDFCSVPFGPPGPSADPDAPTVLSSVLRAAFDPAQEIPAPLRYDSALADLFSQPLGRAALPLDAQLRVARALGLVPPA